MKPLFTILILALTIPVISQTAFTVANSHDKDPNAPSQLSVASLRNPYLGGKLLYNIREDVSDFFQLSGRAQYAPIQGENFAIPFVTNVDLTNDSLVLDDGVDIGVYPWIMLGHHTNFALIFHGGLSYTITNGEAAGDLFTILAGLEVAFWGNNEDTAPITLSAAPALVFQKGPLETENSFGLELTGVVPIANGLGLILEGTIPFDKVTLVNKGIKAGIMANGILSNRS